MSTDSLTSDDIADLQRDAARYRYLKENVFGEFPSREELELGPCLIHYGPYSANWRRQLDDAIDAMMRKLHE